MSQNEKCIICGKLTEYSFDTPISEREGFVPGSGQLCKDCFALLHSDVLEKRRRELIAEKAILLSQNEYSSEN